jgi:hypothetical protein
MRETTMTELSKPKIIPIEHRPQKSKLFIKCVVLPIVIFLIVAKIFSFGAFGYIFFGFDLFWFVILYYLYEYGNTYFDGMTEQLKRQGETLTTKTVVFGLTAKIKPLFCLISLINAS